MVHANDRRKRDRVALQWPVRLLKSGAAGAVETTTRNVSSVGFYCFSTMAFQTGEFLDCVIVIPPQTVGYGNGRTYLECRVKVARVEPLGGDEGYGVACRIEEYTVVHEGQHVPASTEPSLATAVARAC